MKLQSPRTLKEAQSLNGKLTSLNRFLSKSAEKSLPFFKTLKRCVKKSDFQWTPEVERALKNMKKCIAELPMVTAPKPKEELIMYLYAAREAVSAVLLTKRDSRQILIYFVNRALQTPEINYNTMEKVALVLVHATRRLRRYFQAHPVAVIMDQPIKQILSRPENTGRMLKWKFKLEAFDITYRPRTSIRGQVLADFIVEKSDEGGSSTEVQAKKTILEPWILFTDVSSCLEGSGAGLILTSPRSAGRNTQKKSNRRKGNPSNSGRRGTLLDDTVGQIPHGRYPTSGSKKDTYDQDHGKAVRHDQRTFLEPWLRSVFSKAQGALRRKGVMEPYGEAHIKTRAS
ncbi:reverse transcriptase domain-containing protein [Tanacetum coccineum]